MCSAAYPPVYLYMAGYYYGVDPLTYLIPDNTNPSMCFIAIADYGDESFLVGDTFQRGFYTIYDDDNSRVAFLPHNQSKALAYAAAAPSTVFVNTTTNSSSGNMTFDTFTFVTSIIGSYVSYGPALILLYSYILKPVITLRSPTVAQFIDIHIERLFFDSNH